MRGTSTLVNIAVTVLILLIVFVLIPGMFYVVDQRELAVVLQFGEPVAERTEPGISLKTPFIQEVRKLPSTRQFWQPGEALPDLPTADGKKVEVIPWAIWRIEDPTTFVQVLVTMEGAQRIVAQVVRSAVRDGITKYPLAELVRSTNRELTYSFQVDSNLPTETVGDLSEQSPEQRSTIAVGREKILAEIKERARQILAREDSTEETGGRGIELIDVGIAKIDFVPDVREAAFDRLIAFMDSIASYYTNEGEREKQEILNRTHAEAQRIEGEGMKQANEIRGQVEAEIIREYASAIEQAGEFYNFQRTLDAYKQAFSDDTRLILTTDSDFLRLIKQLDAPGTAAPELAREPESPAPAGR